MPYDSFHAAWSSRFPASEGRSSGSAATEPNTSRSEAITAPNHDLSRLFLFRYRPSVPWRSTFQYILCLFWRTFPACVKTPSAPLCEGR